MDPVVVTLMMVQAVCVIVALVFFVIAEMEDRKSKRAKADALKKFADDIRSLGKNNH